MNEQFLQEIGLTKSQAIAYAVLIKNSPCSPPALAKLIQESRTNTYKLLDSLEALELVNRDTSSKKIQYWANNPTALSKLVEKRKETAALLDRKLEAQLPTLLNYYLQHTELPGVRYYQGQNGLKQIYLDQIATKEDIYIIRPHYNLDAFDFDYMTDIRRMAREAGIKRYAITPDRPLAPKNYKASDPYMLLERTWMHSSDYTSPVEWNAYGDKIAIMSFGKEVIGLIIDSPQIAESLKQLYRLVSRGLKLAPNYDQLPLEATFIGDTPGKKADPLDLKQQKLAR